MNSKATLAISHLILIVTISISGQVQAGLLFEEVWTINGGSFQNSDSDSGSAVSPFSSNLNTSVTGQVSQFDVVGATLLSFVINGNFYVDSDGVIEENNPQGLSPGGTLSADIPAGFASLLGDTTGGVSSDSDTCTYPEVCGVEIDSFINYIVSDLSTVLGFGTIDVIASATSSFTGGGDEDDTFTHDLSLSWDLLRIELAYCTQEAGAYDCDAPVIGENSPDPSTRPVPEPATLTLFGIGLAGLGWSRRKKV